MKPFPLARRDRAIGGIIGSLVGDALGVPVEFASRSDRDTDPVNSMRGFGTWNQPAGTWSDDGALLLCTAESLTNAVPNEEHTGHLYVHWLRDGHWAVKGNVFDVGGATRTALERIARGAPAATAGGVGEGDNGNGSLMRILPVAMRFADAGPDIVASLAMRWSAITHRHPRSQLACAYLSLLVVELMHGASPEEGHRQTAATFDKTLASFPSERSHFLRLLAEDFGLSRRPDIRSGGYVIDTLEAALWCLLQGGSYSDIVLRAVNLGGDTDTTGCVAGGLAGVWLGVDSIPAGWKDALAKDPPLDGLIERFVAAAAVA